MYGNRQLRKQTNKQRADLKTDTVENMAMHLARPPELPRRRGLTIGHMERACGRGALVFALFLILINNATTGHGQEEEHAYIHWPPDGSRVSRGSLSSAGIRVEFSGLKSYPYAYRASFSVAFGNSTTVSAHPYDIESNRMHPLSSPSSGLGIDFAQLHRGRIVIPNGTTARWLIPFSAAFSWDGMSHVLDEVLGDDPLGICVESDLEEYVTLSIRLLRLKLRGRANFSEDNPSRMEHWSEPSDLAAEAWSSMRLLVRYNDIAAFGNSDEDEGNVAGEVRSRILRAASTIH